jgi:NTP pyrophosphatase (non-canonical NTP hydrolase)
MTDIDHDAFSATEEKIFEGTPGPITFDGYQARATETAVYPGQGTFQGLAYAALGLNGEAGETAEQVKKIWRDEGTKDIQEGFERLLDNIREDLRHGKSHDYTLEIARENLVKLLHTPLSVERKTKLTKELGDTLWYAAQVATELGVSLGDVAQDNLEKLAARRDANLIHGEGSDR